MKSPFSSSALLRVVGVFAAALTGAFAHATLNVTASPNFTSVHTMQTQQFTPVFNGGTSTPVAWAVNGIAGGSSVLGTISTTGLYSAPAKVPAGLTVTIAASAVSGSSTTTATVAIMTGLIHYVSPVGNDKAAGTIGAPWKTIQYAANMAYAGDAVFARGGTYHEWISLPNSGSASAGPIIFQSYPGELAAIDGTGVACCGGFIRGLFNVIGNQSYLIVAGFEIRNYTSAKASDIPAGIFVSGSGSNLSFVNNSVHGITETAGSTGAAFGIGISGYKTTPLTNIAVNHNIIYGNKVGNSEALLFDGNVNGFQAIGNVVHDNNNIAIDAIGFWGTGPSGQDQARNGIISGNTVYNNTSLYNPSYLSYGADGIYCDGCSQVVIEHNTVYGNDLNIEAASEVMGHLSTYVTIRNNLVYSPNCINISIGGYRAANGGSDHVVIANNTIYGSTTQNYSGSFQVGYNTTNNVFENNLIHAGVMDLLFRAYTNSSTSAVTSDYNVYFTSGSAPMWYWSGVQLSSLSAFQGASGQDKHSSFVDPKLVSVISPMNLNLQTGSPAMSSGNFGLGAATYGTSDYAGHPRTIASTINVGAYQK